MDKYSSFSKTEPSYRCLFLCDDANEKKTNMKLGMRIPGDELNDLNDFLGYHKVLIAVTMYDEDFKLFHKTMKAINHNLKDLLKIESNNLHPEDVAVVVVVDGIDKFTEKLKKKVFKYYKNIFDPEKIISDYNLESGVKKISNDLRAKLEEAKRCQRQTFSIRGDKTKIDFYRKKPEYAVCFKNEVSYDGLNPELTVYFCVKLENKRKLNSHLWFFGGFCRIITPKFCILIDVGTVSGPKSLYYMCKTMNKNKNVAGVCGEILPEFKDESIFSLLVKAQKVEYKFAHILDKSLETLSGYISVLPGAFSAYRWSCLKPDDIKGPLWGSYFKSIMEPEKMNCYYSNIYLAEDRVLCLALISCKDESYILKYVEKAKAFTDPPLKYSSLLSQRRRWINGSWFAMLDSLMNWKIVWGSNHSRCRKIMFTIQMIYYVFSVIYSFFLVGGFYIALLVCLRENFGFTGSDPDTYITIILKIFYVLMLLITLILSLGSPIKEVNSTFKLISLLFSIYMVMVIALLIKIFLLNMQNLLVLIPVCLNVFCFFVILCLNGSLIEVGIGCAHYLILSPTYVNIFNIYAICNIHDCTWGNRPDRLTKEEIEKKEDFEVFRAGWVLLWTLLNCYFGYFLDSGYSESSIFNISIYYIGLIGLGIIFIKFIGGFLFIFNQKYSKFLRVHKSKRKQEEEIIKPIKNRF
jgi:cellulose synthase/poly-beta-1,6-N-acetylglucosamine synthase-like glycosyltransferase